jgi:hypothetical protein
VLINLGLNAEVDIATRDEQKADFDSLLKKRGAKPLLLTLVQSNATFATGGGNGVLSFGHPPSGKLWNILSVTLCGADDTTAVVGKAALYVDSESSTLGLANLRMPNLVIPSWQTITRQTMWAHSTGDICINLTGLSTNITAVTVIVGIAEYHEGDIGAVTTR